MNAVKTAHIAKICEPLPKNCSTKYGISITKLRIINKYPDIKKTVFIPEFILIVIKNITIFGLDL